MQPSYPTLIDMYCGAGGNSQAARRRGVFVSMAVNHKKIAIETHSSNFPDTEHECQDIQAIHPTRYNPSTFLIASPECTTHSPGRGKKRKGVHPRDLWGNAQETIEEVRSRVRMYDPLYWAEIHKYPFVIIENVVEVKTTWAPYESWLMMWKALGYNYKELFLNSMFFYPCPQSRDRLYIVFWKNTMPAPDLDFRPNAYCPRCEHDVHAVQSWKNPNRRHGKYGERNQYIYCCPKCAKPVTPYYFCAATAIDWSDRGERIGDKKKPLVERTRQRVQAGLDKFYNWTPQYEGVPPFLFNIDQTSTAGRQILPTEPYPTQTTNHAMALAQPPMSVKLAHGDDARAYPLTDPARAVTTTREDALIMPPHIAMLRADVQPKAITAPLDVFVASGDQHAVVTPPFVAMLRGANVAKSATDPIDTVAARGMHHAFVSTYNGNGVNASSIDAAPTATAAARLSLVIPPFLSGFYGAREANQTVDTPIPTQTTQRMHSVIQPGVKPTVDECFFRMFRVPEIKIAMAFDKEYIVKGNQEQQIDQLGNAVTPPPMEWMIEACLAVLRKMGG